jgi:hypothetical protein
MVPPALLFVMNRSAGLSAAARARGFQDCEIFLGPSLDFAGTADAREAVHLA